MVRPFDLRDLALIRRLDECGISLHAQSALAENFHPLRGAIVSMLVGGEYPTFVWKSDGGERDGFIQLRVANGSLQAHVLYISPRCAPTDQKAITAAEDTGELGVRAPDCAIWFGLLDEAVAGVGARGIHHVIAEVDEYSPELVVLRRAGFAIYTRQDIWTVDAAGYRPQGLAARKLSPRTPTDDWDIQLLYANTVPRLVQLVEPVPNGGDGEGWVLRSDNELAAYVSIYKGDVATWVRLFIHPEAESEADEIVAAALDVTFAREPAVVYCCVRRYESWLPSALERSGFRVCSSQAVMVRHTVHHAPRPMPETALALDGQRITVSSPIVRNFRRPENKFKKRPVNRS